MSTLKWIGSIFLAILLLGALAVGTAVFSTVILVIVVAAFIRYGVFGGGDKT